jgi:hypothetical protein
MTAQQDAPGQVKPCSCVIFDLDGSFSFFISKQFIHIIVLGLQSPY